MNQKITIAISREYGSGGRAIGEKLAEELGVHYYDKEILKLASVDSGINEALFNNAAEVNYKRPLFRGGRGTLTNEVLPPESGDFLSDRNLFNYQAKTIRHLCETESCVIVGRCAPMILKDYTNVVRVFVHAPKAYLLENAAKKVSMPPRELEKYVEKMNKRRAAYTEYFTGMQWDDARNYDLCVDSSHLGIDGCVKLIKGLMLGWFEGLEL